jgi:IS6 family transposase
VKQLKKEGQLRHNCRLRPAQYLNQYFGAGPSAIKLRIKAGQGFHSFWGIWQTIAGYEAVIMIRKEQAKWVGKGEVERQLHLIAAVQPRQMTPHDSREVVLPFTRLPSALQHCSSS